MAVAVSHNHVARGVHGDAGRIAEERGRADPIIGATCGACRAAARERDDGAVGVDEADFVVVEVRNINGTKIFHGDAARIIEKRRRAYPVVGA